MSRTLRIEIRVTRLELEEFKRLAAERKMTVSDLLRWSALRDTLYFKAH